MLRAALTWRLLHPSAEHSRNPDMCELARESGASNPAAATVAAHGPPLSCVRLGRRPPHQREEHGQRRVRLPRPGIAVRRHGTCAGGTVARRCGGVRRGGRGARRGAVGPGLDGRPFGAGPDGERATGAGCDVDRLPPCMAGAPRVVRVRAARARLPGRPLDGPVHGDGGRRRHLADRRRPPGAGAGAVDAGVGIRTGRGDGRRDRAGRRAPRRTSSPPDRPRVSSPSPTATRPDRS